MGFTDDTAGSFLLFSHSLSSRINKLILWHDWGHHDHLWDISHHGLPPRNNKTTYSFLLLLSSSFFFLLLFIFYFLLCISFFCYNIILTLKSQSQNWMFQFQLQQNLSINLKYVEFFYSLLLRIANFGGLIAIQNEVSFWNLKNLYKTGLLFFKTWAKSVYFIYISICLSGKGE